MMKVFITVLCGILLIGGCDKKQPTGTTQDKAEAKYSIKPVEVDGKDVATALGLRIFKFQCRMPEGKYRTLCWAETETEGDDAITKKDIANMWGTIKDGVILFKMPTPGQKGMFFGIGGSHVSSSEFSIPLTGSRGWSMNPAIPNGGAYFEPGDEVVLVEYLAADANGMSGPDHFDHRVRVKMIIEPEDKPS